MILKKLFKYLCYTIGSFFMTLYFKQDREKAVKLLEGEKFNLIEELRDVLKRLGLSDIPIVEVGHLKTERSSEKLLLH